jgi:hypothetical protein
MLAESMRGQGTTAAASIPLLRLREDDHDLAILAAVEREVVEEQRVAAP